jgi:hypothetical protein
MDLFGEFKILKKKNKDEKSNNYDNNISSNEKTSK